MVIFVGETIKGGFAREVLEKEGKELIFISPCAHIKEQKGEILLKASQGGCTNIIYDVEDYLDDPDVLIHEIMLIRKANGAEPIIYTPTMNPKNLIVQEATNKGIKRFIDSSQDMGAQKEQLIFCITGYYDKNEREDVQEIIEVQKKKEIKERSYKTIGVAGTIHRIGTTTQAIQIVKFLISKGYKACYVEVNETKYKNILIRKAEQYISYAEKVKIAFEIEKEDDDLGMISYEKVDMLYKPDKLANMDEEYDYYVYDYGTYSDRGFNKAAFLKDDLTIFVTGANPTEIDYTIDIAVNSSYIKSKLLFSFLEEAERESFIGYMKDYNAAGRCFFVPYTPNPFVLCDPLLYENLLLEILPDSKEKVESQGEKKKKKGFSLFKKKNERKYV